MTGNRKYSLVCFVYDINCTVLFADVLFLGVALDVEKYIFPWQTFFLWGLSWIQVNTVCWSY